MLQWGRGSSFEATKAISIKAGEASEEGPESAFMDWGGCILPHDWHWDACPKGLDSCISAQYRLNCWQGSLLTASWKGAQLLPSYHEFFWLICFRFPPPGRNRAPTVCMAQSMGLRDGSQKGRLVFSLKSCAWLEQGLCGLGERRLNPSSAHFASWPLSSHL